MKPMLVKKGTEGKIDVQITLADKLTAPVDMGQTVGEIIYSSNGETLSTVKVYTSQAVERADFLDIFINLLRSIVM